MGITTAGVTSTPTVATVPCPRSVGFSLFQIDFSPVGESTTFLKRQLPRRSIIDFSFSYCMLFIYFAMFCKLYGFSQPNLLPVAGGGCLSPYAILRMYSRSFEPRYWLPDPLPR